MFTHRLGTLAWSKRLLCLGHFNLPAGTDTAIAVPSGGLMAHVARAQSLARTVEVPRSVPGLATQRLLVMNFVEGDQINRLEHRTKDLSARWAC